MTDFPLDYPPLLSSIMIVGVVILFQILFLGVLPLIWEKGVPFGLVHASRSSIDHIRLPCIYYGPPFVVKV